MESPTHVSENQLPHPHRRHQRDAYPAYRDEATNEYHLRQRSGYVERGAVRQDSKGMARTQRDEGWEYSRLFHSRTTHRLEAHCASLDRQIDAAVYELYGLTEEEIAIVEDSLGGS